MIIINSIRAIAVILLASILIIKEVPFKGLFKDAMFQFYLALTCMLFLLLVDNILGFILSICLLSLYFRIYTSELKSKKTSEGSASDAKDTSESQKKHGNGCNGTDHDKCEMNMAHLNTDKGKYQSLEQPSKTTLVASSEDAAKAANSEDAAKAANSTFVPYITEENLLAAQSNIVNPIEYNNELHGVDKGIYNEDVYGSQGLDTKNIHIRGYDTNSAYLGSLSYEII
jgi:Ca2+/Na+ antiporter